ncbi:hypothetical protein LZ31DRAFT_364642 [Colletotrichum somersetense]|nr:hypothetical protein LZ31DRAFT_364642 [Colletotrichum somersetense]
MWPTPHQATEASDGRGKSLWDVLLQRAELLCKSRPPGFRGSRRAKAGTVKDEGCYFIILFCYYFVITLLLFCYYFIIILLSFYFYTSLQTPLGRACSCDKDNVSSISFVSRHLMTSLGDEDSAFHHLSSP